MRVLDGERVIVTDRMTMKVKTGYYSQAYHFLRDADNGFQFNLASPARGYNGVPRDPVKLLDASKILWPDGRPRR